MHKGDSKPTVSVIVTTYNRQELLKETLVSILNQTYKDFELIVVDNFSDYDFPDFIRTIDDPRIRPFQNQNNGIIAINRNIGIRNARGIFIAFCDDDDLWKTDKIEKQLAYFTNGIEGVGTNAVVIGDVSREIMKNINENIELTFDQIFYQSVPLSSLIIRNTGVLFDENPFFKAVEDADLQLQLLCNNSNRIVLLSEPLIYYRVHSLNESSPVQNKVNFLNVLEKFKPFMSSIAYSEKYAHFHYCLGFSALKQNTKNSRQYLKLAMSTSSRKRKLLVISLILISFFPSGLSTILFQKYYQLKQLINK